MGKIYYLMGKSAVGKDTIYKRLLEDCPRLRPVILYTTRPMRDGETDGIEYHFTSREKLDEYVRQGKVIEMRTYATVAGPWSYATVDDGHIGRDGMDYLAIGTLESYEKVRDYFGQEKVCPLYITVEDEVRAKRAEERERRQKEPNFAEMRRRFLADDQDFSEENLRRSGIRRAYQNEDLDRCVREIKADMES